MDMNPYSQPKDLYVSAAEMQKDNPQPPHESGSSFAEERFTPPNDHATIGTAAGWLKVLQDAAYETAKSKGWWPQDDQTDLHKGLLRMHGELSEAMEELSRAKDPRSIYYVDSADMPFGKPCGVAVELADVLLIMLGYCARFEIPLSEALMEKMVYNQCRPHKHGGKEF